MSTYHEKLKDPRWQRKRLEVMERANFTCQKCHDSKRTLNVHHLYYMSKRDPWEYPSFALQCLCEECHNENHLVEKKSGISAFESVMTWIVGDNFENPFFYEIANQMRQVRQNGLLDEDSVLEQCALEITILRVKNESRITKEETKGSPCDPFGALDSMIDEANNES